MDQTQHYVSDAVEDTGNAGDASATAGINNKSGDDELPAGVLREQDRFLPIANVARIMKRAVPANGKIAKEARECLQECVSEFISFITGEASDRCHQEKRKTINGEDILFAMSVLGFDNYVDPLKLFLQRYRESVKGDRLPDNFEVEAGGDILAGAELNGLHVTASAAVSQSANVTAADSNILYSTYGSFT